MTEPDAEQDTIETFRALLRTGMTAAAQIAQRVARAREQEVREAEAGSQQHTAELQSRLTVECEGARATVSAAKREDWWATARPDEISYAYETAQTWRDVDPQLKTSANEIRDQVRTRFGVDVDQLHTDAVTARADARGQDQTIQRSNHSKVAAEDLATSASTTVLLSGAATADTTAAVSAEQGYESAVGARAAALYDSADRRADLAEELELVAPADAVQARVLADTGQGRPVRDVTSTGQVQTAGLRRRGAGGPGLGAEKTNRLGR